MNKVLMLGASALLTLPAFANTAASDCINARDPVRCEARQAALTSCAAKRGAEKQACLEASLPPVDCSKSQNPRQCEAVEQAKLLCAGKSGKAEEKCLRDQQTKTRKSKPRRAKPRAE
ncbi:MAG: hypothetical protein K9K30_06305 [Burkholderiaceae bacterium]|nr:hypothetical protein [Sulfuritalea sp.]MCF8174838.1 hypothetical protein [Burkholderiaceae bacterium]